MRIEELRVAVVGGAAGGCVTALLLARAGARVMLFERVREPAAVGAGIAIAANGFAVMEAIGLGPALAAAPRVLNPRVVDGQRRTLMAPRGDAGIRMMRRSTLQRVLLDAVAAEPLITTRFGSSVRADRVRGRLVLSDEETGAVIDADLVVAADGVHSQVRGAMDVGARVVDSGIDYLRALVPGEAYGEEAWTAAGIFGSFNVDGGAYLFASAGSVASREALRTRDLVALREAWRDAYEVGAVLLERVERWEQLLINRVLQVTCARWSEGHVALLGDAAHAMAPNLGQGANSAMVDAAVLLDSLRRSATLREGLAAYEARRKPAVTRVATLAARLGRLSEATHPVSRWLRDRMLMPIAQRVGGDPTAQLLQESPQVLLAIGRA